MRHINTNAIDVPDNWLDIAKQELGNTYPSLWTFFKDTFEEKFGKKCWFTESENIGAVNPIDHFRPKANNVAKLSSTNADLVQNIWDRIDAESRVGYPFLEFEFTNFRYACAFCNSLNKDESKKAKGKRNYFPLKKGSAYASSIRELPLETNCLLDPCVSTDPELLTFNERGEVKPHVSVLESDWEYCRVKVSIELYHLHYSVFVERRSEIWDSCKTRIEIVDSLIKKINLTKEEQGCLQHYIMELKKMSHRRTQFSAVSIDCIRHYKQKNRYFWLDKFFPESKLAK